MFVLNFLLFISFCFRRYKRREEIGIFYFVVCVKVKFKSRYGDYVLVENVFCCGMWKIN